ncbi:MAG: MBL fold metallo-hydrolase [Dehalococcoidia bacterium]
MEVHILGAHNIETGKTRLTSLLIDGCLAIDAGGLTSTLSLSQQEKVKTVLLTHHHFDHTRDLLTLGFNVALWKGQIEVYALHPLSMLSFLAFLMARYILTSLNLHLQRSHL